MPRESFDPPSRDEVGARVARRAGFVPKHGRGFMAPTVQPGDGPIGARGNTPVRMVRILAKQKSPEVCKRLINIALHDEDTRVAVVACQQVLTWAFGKPENLKAEDGEAKPSLDLSKLSGKELTALLKALQSGRVADQVAPAGADDGGEPGEPTVIEGTAEAT